MSVDINYLKSVGVSSAAYKKIFTLEPASYPTKIKKLVDVLSGRLRDGYEMSFRDYRAYQAIDLACELPFNQTTPTLIQALMAKHLSADQIYKELKAWGLSEESLFLDATTPAGQPCKMLNVPVFFQIFIPIVNAYLNAVTAQIFNERNQSPLLPYNPLKTTSRNQVLCEIITDLVQTMSTWYGYPSVMKQAIQQALKYGVMIAFAREEWDYEEQIVDYGGGPEHVTVKEGLRYVMPHPTRMFYDLKYPLTTINSDTGCEWGGHWHILSYGDVLDNPMYWNRKNIFSGTNWFQAPVAGNYFTEVYPCQLKFPEVASRSSMKREDQAAWYNTSQDRDKAIFVTQLFMKLVPKTWGLADYKYPVWHRFTLAGDDTVIWAEPCAYNPMWFMGFNYDEMSARQTSLALECIPFQDHLGNILSQMILTAKQNLGGVTFYNNQAVDKDDISRLNNLGENRYRSHQYIGYDPLKFAAARIEIDRIFQTVELGKYTITELLQMIPTVLNIMERVIGIPAQMGGAQGTHQQSKEEIVRLGGAGNNRINLICSSVDAGIDAWKVQLHAGSQSYADSEWLAEVSSDIEDLAQHIKELGFQIRGKSADTVLLKGHRKHLRLEGFSASNQGPQRENNKEIAQVIFQTVGVIAGQEALMQEVTAKNLLKLIVQAAILAGAPRDFDLRLDPNAKKPEQVSEAILKAIQQAQQATLAAVQQKIAAPVAKEVAADQQKIQQLEEVVKQLRGIYELAAANQNKAKIEQEKTAAKLRMKAVETQSAEQRKQVAFDAEERRKQEKHALEMQQQTEKAQLDTAIDSAQAAAAIEIKKKEAAAKPPPSS